MTPYLILVTALAFAAQASCEEWDFSSLNDLQSDHAKLGEELKSLATYLLGSAKDQVQNRLDLAQATLELSKERGLQAINRQYDAVSRHMRSIDAPQVCLNEAQSMLEESKASAGRSFFRCSNLTTAALDLVNIGADTLELITNVLLSLDDILNGWSGCFSWNPLKFIYCTYTYIKTAISDIFKTFGDLRKFTETVTNLVKDIKDQISYCSNSGVNVSHQDTIKSLEHIHQCSENIKNQKH